VVAARTLTRLALVAGPFVVGCWATWWLWVDADLIVALALAAALFIGAFPAYGALEERTTADIVDPGRESLLRGLGGVAAAAVPGVVAMLADACGAHRLSTALWLDCALAATGALVSIALAAREPGGRVPA
jgi:hypothetical protein